MLRIFKYEFVFLFPYPAFTAHKCPSSYHTTLYHLPSVLTTAHKCPSSYHTTLYHPSSVLTAEHTQESCRRVKRTSHPSSSIIRVRNMWNYPPSSLRGHGLVVTCLLHLDLELKSLQHFIQLRFQICNLLHHGLYCQKLKK
jgi:hypothetical protein